MKTMEAGKPQGKRLGFGLTHEEVCDLQDSMQDYGRYMTWAGPMIVLVIVLSILAGALMGN